MLHYDAVPAPVDVLLKRLATSPALSEFSLAGGTSLALRFGHRLSVDLDFFTTTPFDPERLTSLLELDARVAGRSVGSLTLTSEGVKLDFLRHAYPLLYAPEVVDGIRMLSVRDVAAMKLNAVANRGSKKDFYDLCLLLEFHSLEEMLTFFEAKYSNSDRFIVLRSLGWFEEAELEPDPVSFHNLTWEDVKRRMTEVLRGLP